MDCLANFNDPDFVYYPITEIGNVEIVPRGLGI